MTEKIICAGFGGQGIMSLGKAIAAVALKKGFQTTWFPCYGAEVRGGTAYCYVIFGDEPIGSPIIDEADTLFIFNEPSLKRFCKKSKKDSLFLIDSSLVLDTAGSLKNVRVLKVPATQIAQDLGNEKVANFVLMGAYLGKKKNFTLNEVLAFTAEVFPRSSKMFQLNEQALKKGIEYVRSVC